MSDDVRVEGHDASGNVEVTIIQYLADPKNVNVEISVIAVK